MNLRSRTIPSQHTIPFPSSPESTLPLVHLDWIHTPNKCVNHLQNLIIRIRITNNKEDADFMLSEISSSPSDIAYLLSEFCFLLMKQFEAYIVLLKYPNTRKRIASIANTYKNHPLFPHFKERLEQLLDIYSVPTEKLALIDLTECANQSPDMITTMSYIREQARRIRTPPVSQQQVSPPVRLQEHKEHKERKDHQPPPVRLQETQDHQPPPVRLQQIKEHQEQQPPKQFSLNLLFFLFLLIWIAPAGYSSELTVIPVRYRYLPTNQPLL